MGKDLKGNDIGKGFSQRKDGRYEARARINGIQIDIYNMSLAQLKKDFKFEKEKALKQKEVIRSNTTLKEWYGEWFEKCKSPQLKTESSKETYNRKIKNTFIAVLGDKQIKDITQINIQTAANELTEKYNEKTIKSALGSLKECLEVAYINNLTSVNPCCQIVVKNSNSIPKERRVLAVWEQNLLLEEIKNSYYKELYQFLLLTGLRIGELSGLQWNDIDWNKKVININRTLSVEYVNGKKYADFTPPKTVNSYREVPFFGETEDLLKSWKVKQDMCKDRAGDRWKTEPRYGDLIFTNTMGSPLTRQVITHDLRRVENNMNMKECTNAFLEHREPRIIEHLHPHCFRHTFATRCFEKGISPVVIQSIMGHANYSTTLSYTHVLDEKKKEEIEKIGNFLN